MSNSIEVSYTISIIAIEEDGVLLRIYHNEIYDSYSEEIFLSSKTVLNIGIWIPVPDLSISTYRESLPKIIFDKN